MELTIHLDSNTVNQLQTGGYVLMGVLMIIEGPFVTFIASFLASLGVFNFSIVLLLGWIGDIIGDFLYFYIGRIGMRMVGKTDTQMSSKHSRFLIKLENLVRKNLFLSLFVIKFTPYVQPIGLMFIGKTHIKYWRYGWYSIILCIPTPLVFGMAGYHLGGVNALLQNTHNEHLILGLIGAATVILICAVVGYYLIKKSKKILNRHLGEKI